MKHHTIRVLGSLAHYWTEGPANGPVVVLVHGFRGTHHGLQDIAAELEPYRVIIPDLPGFGQSEPLTSTPHTIEAYGNWLDSFMGELDLNHVKLVGHSMGSLVVAATLKANPNRAQQVVLINPIAEASSKGMNRLKLAPLKAAVWLAAYALPQSIGEYLLRHPWPITVISNYMVTTRRQPLRQYIHHHHRQYMVRFANRRQFYQSLTSSLSAGVAQYTKFIQQPLLIIAGDSDTIAPVESQLALARKLPNTDLAQIAQVGHLIHYEKPTEAAVLMKRFFGASQ